MNKIRFIQTNTLTDSIYLKFSPEFRLLYLTLHLSSWTSLCGITKMNFAMLGMSLGMKEETSKTLFESFCLRFPTLMAYDVVTEEFALLQWSKTQLIHFQPGTVKKAETELREVESGNLLTEMHKYSHGVRGKMFLAQFRRNEMQKINIKKELKALDSEFHDKAPQIPENEQTKSETKTKREKESKSKRENTKTITFSESDSFNGTDLKGLPIPDEIDSIYQKKDKVFELNPKNGLVIITSTAGEIEEHLKSSGMIEKEPEEPKPKEPKFKPKPRKGNEILKPEQEYKNGLKALIIKKVKRKGIVAEYLQDIDIGVDEFLESFVCYCYDNDVNYNGYFNGIPELLEIHSGMLRKGETIIPQKAVVSQRPKENEAHYR